MLDLTKNSHSSLDSSITLFDKHCIDKTCIVPVITLLKDICSVQSCSKNKLSFIQTCLNTDNKNNCTVNYLSGKRDLLTDHIQPISSLHSLLANFLMYTKARSASRTFKSLFPEKAHFRTLQTKKLKILDEFGITY